MMKIFHGKNILLPVFIFFLGSSSVYSGEAAPYTEEAVRKIDEAGRVLEPNQTQKNVSKEERMREAVELTRKAFRQAGYDYDATLIKVAEDLQHHPERVPKGYSVVTIIIPMVHLMMSECEYWKMDCMKFFPPDSAEAVRVLFRITDFKI